MDPNQAWSDLLFALDCGEREEAEAIAQDLKGWVGKGGFAPEAERGGYSEAVFTDGLLLIGAPNGAWTMETRTWPVEGSVSGGTLRPEDLLPIVLDELEIAREHAMEFEQVEIDRFIGEVGEGEDGEILGELLADGLYLLTSIAPEGWTFGAHEGDGACFGWWRTEDEPSLPE